MIEEDAQQTILGTAQGHGRAVLVEEMAGRGIELPIAEGDDAACLGHLQIRGQHARAAKHGPDPREQFSCDERLRQIVVRAQLQPHDPIGIVAARRQDQDRHHPVSAGPELAAKGEALIAEHHKVENDEIGLIPIEEGAHLPSVRSRAGAQSVLLAECMAHDWAGRHRARLHHRRGDDQGVKLKAVILSVRRKPAPAPASSPLLRKNRRRQALIRSQFCK